jgi:hypothetical protein
MFVLVGTCLYKIVLRVRTILYKQVPTNTNIDTSITPL